MNIGQASDTTGLRAKTIRYYEEIELVKSLRAANGYRDYADEDINRLAFLQRARCLGFTIQECHPLLSLYEDTKRASADVKALTLDNINEIDRKLTELNSLKSILKNLADLCHGDDGPDCPIIDDFAGIAAK